MSRVGRLATQSAKLAVKYGPAAKIAWDRGGRTATLAATQRLVGLNARRRALAHASGVIDGSVLKVAPEGRPVWVVFTRDLPIAAYPAPPQIPLTVLLQHADLAKRVRPDDDRPALPVRPARRLRRSRPPGGASA